MAKMHLHRTRRESERYIQIEKGRESERKRKTETKRDKETDRQTDRAGLG